MDIYNLFNSADIFHNRKLSWVLRHSGGLPSSRHTAEMQLWAEAAALGHAGRKAEPRTAHLAAEPPTGFGRTS